MNNDQILATLRQHEIKTLGDLDNYAEVRQVSRWHALALLIGQDAADKVFDNLVLRMAQSKGQTTTPVSI